MRQIKFRGKRVDNGEWVYGSYHYSYNGKNHYILALEKFNERVGKEMMLHKAEVNEVDPSTVGQFTGLLDKNGKEIWEGDLLRNEPKDDWDKINFTCYEVFFHDGNANADYNIGYSIARTYHQGSICGGYIPSFKPKSVSKMIVCGNLHDKPELLTNK